MIEKKVFQRGNGSYVITVRSIMKKANSGYYEINDNVFKFHPLKFNDHTVDTILGDVKRELAEATIKFTPFSSAHEGYAVIKEEFDELWKEIKKKHPNRHKLREEALQVGAMAVRFVYDLLKEFSDDP